MSSNEQTFPSFPVPEKDETLYSLFARCKERSGFTEQVIFQGLTGQRHKNALMRAVPGYIPTLASRVPEGHPFKDPAYTLIKHTLFPYFTFFKPQRQRLELRDMVEASDETNPVRLALGLTKYPIPPVAPHLRYCPHCFEQQKTRVGFPFFKRQHQLPGVFVCAEHGTILCHGCKTCGTYPIGNNFFIPGRCNCQAHAPISVIDTPADIKPLIWLARESEYLLHSGGTSYKDARAVIKSAVISKGLASGSIVQYQKLAQEIETRFGSDVLNLLGIEIWQGQKPATWLRRLFDSTSDCAKNKAAFLLLFVIGALFDSVADFELCQDSGAPVTVPVQDPPEKFLGLLQNLKEKNFKIMDVARHCGSEYMVLIRELRRLKAPVPLTSRMKKRLGRSLEQIRADLRSGVPKTEIMSKYILSEETVVLIELDQPDLIDAHYQSARTRTRDKHRRLIVEHLENNPDAGRSDILKNLPSSYDYVMRADKGWFLEQLPSRKMATVIAPRKPKVDWVLLDSQKAEELELLVSKFREPTVKPIHLTKTGLLKSLSINSRYRANADSFPLLQAALARHIESYGEFVVRRICWAVLQYEKTGKIISMNTLRRIASLPAPLVMKHKQLVSQLAAEHGIELDSRSCFAAE